MADTGLHEVKLRSDGPVEVTVPFGELIKTLVDQMDGGQAIWTIKRLLNKAMFSCGATETILEWIYRECDDCEDRRCWAAVMLPEPFSKFVCFKEALDDFMESMKEPEIIGELDNPPNLDCSPGKMTIMSREQLDALPPPALVDPKLAQEIYGGAVGGGVKVVPLSKGARKFVGELLSALRAGQGPLCPDGTEHLSQSTLSETKQDDG